MIPMISLHYRLHHAAWYIRPDYFASIKAVIDQAKLGFEDGSDPEDIFSFFAQQRPPMSIDSNGIALITVSGVLANNLSRFEKLLGFTDFEDIADEVDDALEAPAKAILFEMDCPGGEAQGTVECAQKIAAIDIPKASFTAGLDTSAAYFLSSSVDRKFVSPSAFSGSIGTILPWIDQSKFWDALGLAWEPIIGQGETMKGAGMGPSLTDDQREHFQEQVNAMSAQFRDHVGNYRELDYSQLAGGAYFGRKAIDLNLADDIGAYDDAYQYLFRKIS